jgi:3-methyl-2-oxobutanoate hydroxymethyltransferase
MPADSKTKVTIVKLNKQKQKKLPTVLVTAYSSWEAELADMAGVDCLLVGDSAAMCEHGMETTIGITMNEMVSHVKSVVRGNTNAFVIADFPFGSYQRSDEWAIINAERFVEAGADCVKVEGAMFDRISAIAKSGIITMSHLGLTPHTRAKLGGYKVQGKTKSDYEKILSQAKAIESAGASFLLLEAVPAEVGGEIAATLNIPVYGIGAGNLVDGQLVIINDLIGTFTKFKSKFVKRYIEAGQLIQKALGEYADEVRNHKFPTEEHFYKIDDKELEALLGDSKWKYIPNE